MKIDFLCTFATVVEKGSIKKAAEELGMSVSSVSFQINAVEKYYGAKLLKRSATGVSLTDEGKIALKNMKLITESIEQTRNIILRSKNKITIASGMVGIPVLSHLQTLLKAKYPDLEVSTVLRGAHLCYKMVREGTADFAIGGDLPEDFDEEHYVAEVLGIDELVLIVPPNHELCKKDVVRMSDLMEYSIVCLTKDYGIRTSVEKALLKSGYNLDVCTYVDDFFTQLHLVSSGESVAITSLFACLKAYEVGLIKVIHLEDFESERNIYFVTSKMVLESEKLREYADFIIKNARKFYGDYRRRIAKMVKSC